MIEREQAAGRAQTFFDGLWTQGDYWQLESSPFEHAKYARVLELLSDRRYARTLEIGCGAGTFTRLLAAISDRVLAIDVSPIAIARAQSTVHHDGVEFRAADVMAIELEAEGTWDLAVINETIYYLGWLHSCFDVAWLAERVFAAVTPGGRLLMANTLGESMGYLLRPPLIRTYRDLFVNVGFRVEHEEVFRGTKDETPIDVLITRFTKPTETAR